VRLKVQPGIAGAGIIGAALVGIVMSAAIAPPQIPSTIANEVTLPRNKFFIAPRTEYRQNFSVAPFKYNWLLLAVTYKSQRARNIGPAPRYAVATPSSPRALLS
jgi:hypothetical protein